MPGYEMVGWALPAREMGGDFYDFIPLGEARWGVALGDVAGTGLPAALYMVVAKSLLWPLATEGLNPSQVLERLNHLLAQVAPVEMFISLLYGVVDIQRHLFRYANGGHWPPLLVRPRGEVEWLGARGRVLGVGD
ncbi:MAG: PP2C family protein-serine/threonine phosphatase, partial [Chloroflexus sp.]